MSTTKKTLGLVIASYKYGHLAAHCIETAIGQTKPFNEILFVDDGAGDCSHLEKIYASYNIKFHFNEKNLGIVDTFNKMLNNVTTDYVMFVGADNWLASDSCETISRVLYSNTSSDIDIVTYDIIVSGELRNEIYKFYPYDMRISRGDYYWRRDMKHHGSMAYRVQLARECGGYANNNSSPRTDEDLNLWNKMMNKNAKLVHIPEAFLYYRRHKENFNKY